MFSPHPGGRQMTVAILARLLYRPLIGSVTGASAALVIACTPATGMPGMRADLGGSRPAGQVSTAASVGPVIEVSNGCAGQNAEAETATGAPGFVYEIWIGCGGIGFARSTDGGAHFSTPVTAPGSGGASWDPSLAVA